MELGGGRLGKEGPEWPELKLMGGLIEKRMLILKPSERNIRRTGSLQSPNRAPIGEAIGVTVMVGGGLLRSGGR